MYNLYEGAGQETYCGAVLAATLRANGPVAAMARTALRETEPPDIEAAARTHAVLPPAEALSVGIEKARVHEE
ncbi:MAG: hypothetical protein ACLU0O_08700 [Collinsella sp.]